MRCLNRLLSLSLILVLAASTLSLLPSRAGAASSVKIVGYLSGWTIANVPNVMSSVQFGSLTHLIYSNFNVTSATDATLWSGWGTEQAKTWLSQSVSAGHSKGCKVLFSIEDDGTGKLMGVVSSSTLRAQLVTNVVNLLTTYDVDGVDIDWEEIAAYGAKVDLLISDLYGALNPLGKMVTVSGAWDRINISLASANKVAFINVMTYDMYYSPATSVLPVNASYSDTVAGVNLWVNAGYPKDKLLLGMPFYGYDSDHTAVLYGEIVDALGPSPDQNQANISLISTPRGSIAITGGTLWWNGVDLAMQKTAFVKTEGLGGVMCFDVGQDKLNDSRSLLQNVYDELRSTSPTNTPPSVTAGAVSNVTPTGANLNANLTGMGTASTVTVGFEYGLTASYGSTVAAEPSTLSTAGAFSAGIAGLTPNTLYHYRSKAVGDGTSYSSDRTFTTAAALAPLAVTTGSLTYGTVGVLYSQTLVATGGMVPYTWTVGSGQLPAGLALSSNGVISGTPMTSVGSTSVTFQVTDSAGATATKTLTMKIANARARANKR
jgi:hypothetical protein